MNNYAIYLLQKTVYQKKILFFKTKRTRYKKVFYKSYATKDDVIKAILESKDLKEAIKLSASNNVYIVDIMQKDVKYIDATYAAGQDFV